MFNITISSVDEWNNYCNAYYGIFTGATIAKKTRFNERKLENIVVAWLGSELLMKPLIFWSTGRVLE